MGRGKTKTENVDELSKVIKSYDDHDSHLLIMAISKIGDETLIGTCAVVKDDNGEFEVGYRFSESHWGNGFGSEILKGLLQYCLNDLELNKVNAIIE